MYNRRLVFSNKFPRDFEKRQNEIPNRNVMGSLSEIRELPKYQRLREFNKTITLTSNENRKFTFYQETTKLLGNLKLSLNLRVYILINANNFYSKLIKHSKNRSPRVLIPVSIYITCTERFVFIKKKDFYDYCPKNAFNRCLKEILRKNNLLRLKWFSDEFRVKLILVQLNGIRNHFKLSELFFSIASKNLYQYYNLLKNTKLEVITGRIIELTRKNIRLNNNKYGMAKICDFLGIARASIIWRD